MNSEIAYEVKLDHPYQKALELTTSALKAEGFGVLTHIDVRATLKEKLGKDIPPYSILGACNPPLAHRALSQDPVVGLMLPCNVTVESNPDGGAIIRLANPETMLTIGNLQDNPELMKIANEVRERIERVANSLTVS
ncbi:MAG: DUF302 domain-containing protein [Anaerolineales bacterium]|jgi:uncharacterized protein (DUF302 family)